MCLIPPRSTSLESDRPFSVSRDLTVTLSLGSRHLSMSSLGIFPSPFGPIPWWQEVFSISFGKLCMLPGKLRCGSLDSWRALDATFHSARRLCMSAMCGSWQYPHRDSFLACTSLADWHPVPLVIRPSPPQQYIALELRRNCSTSPHSPSILTTR